MGTHSRRRERGGKSLIVIVLAVVAVAGLASIVRALNSTSPVGASSLHQPGNHNKATGTSPPPAARPSPPAPLTVTAATPAEGATGVNGTGSVVFRTSAAVDLSTVAARMSPAVPGRWSASPSELVFTPDGAFPPSASVTITLPAGLRDVAGGISAHPVTASFTTASGSILRLQQLLAQLGYLPVAWTQAAVPARHLLHLPPARPRLVPGSPAQGTALAERAVYDPPAGSFSWRWASPPPSLQARWSPGAYTVIVKGAVMAFEADHNLSVDGIAGPVVWHELLAVTEAGSPDPSPRGYTYALASKSLPETLTVWHNGTVVASSRANTGIPVAPTADGTFPVYERLATQIMRGTNPDGSKYADPVAWVAYFNGGDAVHYIARAAYGFPQSLGCVEVPYQVGKTIWPYLTIGTLVTVAS